MSLNSFKIQPDEDSIGSRHVVVWILCKVAFYGYLSAPYFTSQHNRKHDFEIKIYFLHWHSCTYLTSPFAFKVLFLHESSLLKFSKNLLFSLPDLLSQANQIPLREVYKLQISSNWSKSAHSFILTSNCLLVFLVKTVAKPNFRV
jgi:hypothetical protein